LSNLEENWEKKKKKFFKKNEKEKKRKKKKQKTIHLQKSNAKITHIM